MSKIPCFLIIVVLIMSCSPKKQQESVPSDIVLVFENYSPRNMSINLPDGLIMDYFNPEMKIIDGKFVTSFKGSQIKNNDTLRINPVNDHIVIQLLANPVEFFDYLATKGDTLVFSYANGIPILKGNNFRKIVKEKTWNRKDFSPLSLFYNPEIETGLSFGSDKSEFYKNAISYFTEQRKVLASFINEMDKSEYVYFYNKILYDSLSLSLIKDKMDVDECIEHITHWDSLGSGKYTYGLDFLLAECRNSIYPNCVLRDTRNGGNLDRKKTFKAIQNRKCYSEESKLLLLEKELDIISKENSVKDFLTYYDIIFSLQTDSLSKVKLQDKYFHLLQDNSQAVNNLFLFNKDREAITLDSLLKQNRGKVVYIDFWASWCSPCVEALPYSYKLRGEYKDKPVEFVYLSIDSDFVQWDQSLSTVKLDNCTSSYFVANYKTSEFIRKYNIKTIPRYLLFDKQGELVLQKAPDPESTKIRKEINKLL